MNVALPFASVVPKPVRPAFGPDWMAKFTATLDSGWPQLFVKVAVTVALMPTPRVWLGGARVSADPGQGAWPIVVHWVDSLPMQSPASIPPVFRTCPAFATGSQSMYDVVVPLTVTSTTALIPFGVQLSV